MDIMIISRGSSIENITRDVINRINQSAGSELEWKIEHIGDAIFFSTTCNNSISAVEKLFDELLELYPTLDISASYSFSVREDDGSADWWESVSISTEKKSDGTRYLKKSSGTYWN